MCYCVNACLLYSSYNTTICQKCGVERFVGCSPTPLYNLAPLPKGYSRSDRFRILVKKILGTHPGPPHSDDVWQFLARHKPYNSLTHIVSSLKQSKLKLKHYQCVHVFRNIFGEHPPKKCDITILQTVEHQLCALFDKTLRKWNRHYREGLRFFSYPFLLEKFLRMTNKEAFLCYLKTLQCPIRRDKYEELWKRIFSDGSQIREQPHRCAPIKSHSPSERTRKESPHNLRYRGAEYQDLAVQRLARYALCRTYMQHALAENPLVCST